MQQFVWTYYTSFCTFSKSTVGLCKKGLCPKYCLHKDKTFMNVSDVQCVTFRPWVFCVQWIEWWASSPTPIYVSCQLHAGDLTLPPGGSPTLNPLTAGLSKPMLYIYNARLWHNLAHKQISYIFSYDTGLKHGVRCVGCLSDWNVQKHLQGWNVEKGAHLVEVVKSGHHGFRFLSYLSPAICSLGRPLNFQARRSEQLQSKSNIVMMGAPSYNVWNPSIKCSKGFFSHQFWSISTKHHHCHYFVKHH